MAEEDKNQDPEEGKRPAGGDDDFGLPDFEFEALDDDDDDEVIEETPVNVPSEKKEEVVSETNDDVPSLDEDDLEGLDLEGLDDIDMGDLGDLDDLEDLDLDDLDLEDINLDDLDKELANEGPSPIREEKPPVAASAERIEDIFDEPRVKKAEKEEEVSDTFEDSDDGLFYEEESFEDFDSMVEGDSSSIFEDSGDSGDMDFDHDLFEEGEIEAMDFGTDDPDKDELSAEAVPFAKRPVEKEYQLTDESVEEVSEAEIKGSRGKFIRIVILGTVMFVAIGFGFMYFGDSLSFGDGDKPKVVTAKKKESPIVVAKNEEPKKEENANSAEQKAETVVTTPPAKKEEVKTTPKQDPPKQEVKKEVVKKEEAKKPVVTKPAETKPKPTAKTTPIKSTPGGVTVLSSETGQRHLIVASFTDNESAQTHASKLAAKGESPVIIPPFGGAPNYRVAIASYSTQGEALQNLDNYRQQYGSGVWILKY